MRIVILVIALCFSSWSYSGGFCTGFLISSNGYIGTAGHCYGHRIVIGYRSGGRVVLTPAKIIEVDSAQDTMLLKIDVKDLPFFTVVGVPEKGSQIIGAGFPLPDRTGLELKTELGEVISEGILGINLRMWAGVGASGEPIINNNGQVVGILVSIFSTGDNYSGLSRATYTNSLLRMMSNNHVVNFGSSSASIKDKIVYVFIYADDKGAKHA